MSKDAHGVTKQALKLETDRGHDHVQGVYAMFVDKFPLGVAFNKGLHFHMGQMHGPKYIPRLFDYTRRGQVDPSFVFTHRFGLDDIPQAYAMFKSRADNCVKVLGNVA